MEGVPSPNSFIVGAPKCGTTAMAASLAMHPDVFMTSPKEPHAFGADLASFRRRMEPKPYTQLFRGVRSESRVGEASVWYLRSETAAQEIHDFDATARILVMLRNPADMLYSLHGQLLKSGIEHIRDFRAALEAEPERRQGKQIHPGVRFTGPLIYSEAVAYASQLERYFHVFRREQVHVILLDDVRNDPSGVMNHVQQFLGISILDDLALLHLNESQTVRSTRLQWLSRESRFLRFASRSLIPEKTRVRIAERVVRRVEQINVSHRQRPALPAGLRAELNDRFGSEVERLALLLQRDLSSWTGKSICL